MTYDMDKLTKVGYLDMEIDPTLDLFAEIEKLKIKEILNLSMHPKKQMTSKALTLPLEETLGNKMKRYLKILKFQKHQTCMME